MKFNCMLLIRDNIHKTTKQNKTLNFRKKIIILKDIIIMKLYATSNTALRYKMIKIQRETEKTITYIPLRKTNINKRLTYSHKMTEQSKPQTCIHIPLHTYKRTVQQTDGHSLVRFHKNYVLSLKGGLKIPTKVEILQNTFCDVYAVKWEIKNMGKAAAGGITLERSGLTGTHYYT